MARFVALGVACMAFVGLSGAAPEAAQGQPGWGRQEREAPACVVYEHTNYAGDARVFGRSAGKQTLSGRWNDRVSSLRCRPGCQLTAYEHDEGRGAFFLFGGDVPSIGPFWNDKISNVRIDCVGPDIVTGWGWEQERGRGREGRNPGWDWAGNRRRDDRPACTYYEHAAFAGQRAAIADGQEIPSIGSAWNDRISSFSCRPGCVVTVYEHTLYRGAERSIEGEVRSLGAAWNDRISALRAQCR